MRALPAAARWLPLALLASGCFFPKERGDRLTRQVEDLAADQEKARKELAIERERTDLILREKISVLDERIKRLDEAGNLEDSRLKDQLRRAVEEASAVRGRLEEVEHQLQQLRKELEAAQSANDQKLLVLKGEQARAEAEARRRAEESSHPSDKKGWLAAAREKASADPAVARKWLTDWLKKWPKDELAGEAYFAMGDSYASEGNCREAAPEFSRIFRDFPKSRFAPAALMKSYECFKELKMPEEARLMLDELVSSYPDSAEGKQARVRLEELDRAAKKKKKKDGTK
jgi:TolA-binding protein